MAAGVASVFVNRSAGRIEADAVLADNAGGARAGVLRLISQGTAGSSGEIRPAPLG